MYHNSSARVHSYSCLCMQGYGTNFYSAEEYYEGEWHADQRSGWGRMYYADGSVYEGEWLEDKRSGKGLLRLGEQLTTSYIQC